MSPFERALHWLQVGLVLAIVLGLWRRGFLSRALAFPAYLIAVAAPLALFAVSDRFWTLPIWIAKEAVQALLKFVLALELASRIFRPFPRALMASRLSALVVLAAVLVVVQKGPTDLQAVAGRTIPILSYGAVWLFAVTLGLALWHLIPLDPIHKAILLGLVPYLLAFSGAVTLLEAIGWQIRDSVNYLNNAAYIAVLAYWSIAAWRPDIVPTEDRVIIARLQPWRG